MCHSNGLVAACTHGSRTGRLARVANHPRPHVLEDHLGVELAVSCDELYFDVLAQHPVQQRLHELLLVDFGGGLDVALREAPQVNKEQLPVPNYIEGVADRVL